MNGPIVRIGCAGWVIPGVRAMHFPGAGTHLQRYAEVFDCVEINSSFYRPHRPLTYRKWAASVPANFRFSVKMPKAISHVGRLRHCASMLEEFLAQAEQLGEKLGFLLLQLPPSLAYDSRSALRFFDHLRARHDGTVGCEPRHPSWFKADVERALRERRIARVASDPAIVQRAALPGGDHACEYLRLHGWPRMYYDSYPQATLDRTAHRLLRPSDAVVERWCIFDNTALGHATTDALALIRQVR